MVNDGRSSSRQLPAARSRVNLSSIAAPSGPPRCPGTRGSLSQPCGRPRQSLPR